MKHTLLALAVLATFANVASAQSSVTVYGIVDAGITAERGGAEGSITKLATGVQQGNRLGFKGTEDLGSGLKAIFQLESGFNADTGTGRQGALFGRQAYVGLAGNFGTLSLGRQYDPIFVLLDALDPFATGLPGRVDNLLGAGNYRTNNSVMYSTPNVSGFNASVLYGLGERAGNAAQGRTVGFSAGYANGPVVLGVAYDKVNAAPAIGATDASTGQKLWLVGGTYNFGPAMLHAMYQTQKNDFLANPDVSKTIPVGDFRNLMLGVSVPVGTAGTIMASYVQKQDRISNRAEMGGKQLGVAYSYQLSKRSSVYTSYARLNNDDGGSNFIGDASSGGSAPRAGGTSSALTVGMRHKF